MTINGHNYKVVSVANWMRNHPGRTLEDYDRVHVAPGGHGPFLAKPSANRSGATLSRHRNA
uniref:Uncharacterized protein n=1 Tax=Oryza punctata TaxID=4537 RepID=A0A0E0KV11_ORYPU